MKCSLWGSAVLSVALVIVGGSLPSIAVRAQAQAPAAAPAAPDFSQVQIKTTKISSNFYTLEGQGGMVGVLAGPDGVLVVDAQFAPLTEKLVAAIKQVSDGRIRFLINTHVHGDHTGGNENFGKLGATIFARENLRARLIKPNPGANGAPGAPAPAMALPVVTYDAPLTFHMDGEDVRLVPVPSAHTDGDTMVFFPTANVLMVGDFYRSVGYPNIDRANGGSLKGMVDGLNAVVALAGPATKIIPGHGPTVDKTAVAAHRDMILAVRDKVAVMVRQNKTQDEVVAAKLTADFDAKVSGATPMTADRFVGQVYAELKDAK
jgi:glyoxylase-like metal-dependent hydrolase (beta-lactamase superfamily II)